jgi:AcrR family transcriptional regulator
MTPPEGSSVTQPPAPTGTQRMAADDRRKQLLAASIVVFARNGYHGATTRAIAREAGVAEALLYRYFTNKQALFKEAVASTSERLVHGLAEVFVRHPDSPLDAFTELLEFCRAVLLRSESLAKMIFIVSAELDDPEVRDIYLPYQRKALAVIEDAISAWQKNGLMVNGFPPRATAWLVLGSFQALALMKHSGSLREVDAREAFDLIRSLIQRQA